MSWSCIKGQSRVHDLTQEVLSRHYGKYIISIEIATVYTFFFTNIIILK